jgi:hypothetical protein
MPEPLEYRIPTESRRCSVPAVIGFALSLIMPPIGGRLAQVLTPLITTDPDGWLFVLMGVFLCTAGAGVLFCMAAFMYADTVCPPRRGRALAFSGVFINLLWIALFLLGFVRSDYFGWFYRLILTASIIPKG